MVEKFENKWVDNNESHHCCKFILICEIYVSNISLLEVDLGIKLCVLIIRIRKKLFTST